MNYQQRNEALTGSPPEVWTADAWLRGECRRTLGMVRIDADWLQNAAMRAGLTLEAMGAAVAVLADLGVIVLDDDIGLAYCTGFLSDAIASSASRRFVALACSAELTRYPDCEPRRVAQAEIDAAMRPSRPVLQLVADNGRSVRGAQRIAGGAR